ncbi:solute carrier family 53 member 1-like isoform X1 [Ylistrum balloti]|uniref:solute carrier family 53 member 1-like isoform X1 n=1 Tax=Ylistrum balloti TaxID=509963 RepID=UPI002905A8FB|nr:solute carrier family 53 member 1-like isoform X1 [Ylistrum balloti]
MKFAEHLGAHITPEWRKQYIQYEAMKEMLYEAQEQSPSAEVTDQTIIQRFLARFDERFFQFCDKELAKINTFFYEKISEANRKYASLKAEMEAYHEHAHKPSTVGLRQRRASVKTLFKDKEVSGVAHTRKLHDLKLAFSEFYLSLILLQNYQTLNFTGFRKILKKHDKLMSTQRGTEWRQAHVDAAPFYTNKEVDHLITETENSVTSDLEGGNRQKAMKRLRVPPLGETQSPWTTFRVGLFFGWFSVMSVVLVLTAFFSGHSENWEPALRMYRGIFLIIQMIFLLGINTYGWRSSGVNHVLIFEIDPRHHLSHQQLLELASSLAVLWAISVLCYFFSDTLHIPAFVFPLSLTGFVLIFLINPLPILHKSSRMWLLTVLKRIFLAPFYKVGFADFWLADQLNSLSTVLLDFEFLICFYAFEVDWLSSTSPGVCTMNKYGIRAVVSCLPAWFRFAQCLRRYRDTKLAFPHLVNAGKYSTTFFTTVFSTLYKVQIELYGEGQRQTSVFFYLWIGASVISTCYTLTWDIKMDWGLLDKNAGENTFLREEIVYAYKAYYYFAVVEDFVLRFAWTITVSVGEGGYFPGEALKTLLASLEVFRRFVWNFFRLENEHLNNCGQFRAVRDISIAPIDSNDQTQLEDMMDQDDGAYTCRSERKRLMGKASKKDKGALWVFGDETMEKIPWKYKGV